MTWDDYCEKMNDWSVSTAINKISSLENFGSNDEILEVMNEIAVDDEKGATKLLNRAVKYGVKFSAENLAEIMDICEEESFKNALYQSADVFTTQDLAFLNDYVDDELIVDLAKKYRIPAPANIADEYEEELCSDTSTPISWSRFYSTFYDWKPEYAKARLKSVTNFGTGDEVLEVVRELFDDDNEISRFISQALDGGVRFTDDNLEELSGICNENIMNRAALQSAKMFTQESLEKLYGNVSDDIIIEIAKKQNLTLPDDLQEEEEDISGEVYSAIDAADYALECLIQAQCSMNDSRHVSFINMRKKGFLTSLWKYSMLSEADEDIQQAQKALECLNDELKSLMENKEIKLKQVRLASVIDMWFDDGFLDAFTHLQINKAHKRISRAITQVENIKSELIKLLYKK